MGAQMVSMDERKVPMNVAVDIKHREMLVSLAKSRGVSVSVLAREAIVKWLAEEMLGTTRKEGTGG